MREAGEVAYRISIVGASVFWTEFGLDASWIPVALGAFMGDECPR
jgi:hypothetical protein